MLSHLKVFESKAFFYNNHKSNKLDSKIEPNIFIGYPSDSLKYKILEYFYQLDYYNKIYLVLFFLWKIYCYNNNNNDNNYNSKNNSNSNSNSNNNNNNTKIITIQQRMNQ